MFEAQDNGWWVRVRPQAASNLRSLLQFIDDLAVLFADDWRAKALLIEWKCFRSPSN